MVLPKVKDPQGRQDLRLGQLEHRTAPGAGADVDQQLMEDMGVRTRFPRLVGRSRVDVASNLGQSDQPAFRDPAVARRYHARNLDDGHLRNRRYAS